MSGPDRKPTSTLTWTDWRGKEQVRTVNHVLDIRDFRGTAIYPWLLIAANTHLSVGNLWEFLCLVAEEFPRVERSRSWIHRKRWMAQPPDAVNPINRPNSDGKDARALKIMAGNPNLSLRGVVRLLSEHGIRRGKDWVCKNRGVSIP